MSPTSYRCSTSRCGGQMYGLLSCRQNQIKLPAIGRRQPALPTHDSRLPSSYLCPAMKSGFVSIFGKPNAGKSTLLNAITGEKLAIVSPKVQTTRHRIKAIITEKDYQVIFSDTPGIIDPKYKLQEKMMEAVKTAVEDADVAILLVDINENHEEADEVFRSLGLKVPAVVLINKVDKANDEKQRGVENFYRGKSYATEV